MIANDVTQSFNHDVGSTRWSDIRCKVFPLPSVGAGVDNDQRYVSRCCNVQQIAFQLFHISFKHKFRSAVNSQQQAQRLRQSYCFLY